MASREIGIDLYSPENAEAHGFARFNNGPHVCIQLARGDCTISVRTPEGKQVTFAFIPYAKDGEPQCVDIHHANPLHEQFVENGDIKLPVQELLVFARGSDCYRHRIDSGAWASKDLEKKPTLITLLIEDPRK